MSRGILVVRPFRILWMRTRQRRESGNTEGGSQKKNLPGRSGGGRSALWPWQTGWFRWGGVVLLGMGLVVGGCGGGKEKPSRPTPPPPPVEPSSPPPGGPPSPAGPEQPPGQTPALPPGDQKPKEKPTRPEKVENWKREDYFTAKADGDPKLVEALQHFAQKFVGNSKAALMLEELIQVEVPPTPKPEEKPAAPGGPAGAPGTAPGPVPPGVPPGQIPPEAPGLSPGMPGTMGPGGPQKAIQLTQQALEMAIWALVLNNTSEARTVLGKILTGKLNTGMDRVATETALKALASVPSPQNEELLLAALIMPEKLRPPQPKEKPSLLPGLPGTPSRPTPEMPPMGPAGAPGAGYSLGSGEQVTAAWLQQFSLDLVKNHGSASVREKLARYLADPKVPLEVVERLGAFLKEAHPANLRAQLIFLQAPDTTEETRKKLLEYFMKYSSDCLAWVLGIPTGGVSGGLRMGPGGGPGLGPEMPGMVPGTGPGAPGGIPSWMSEAPGALGPAGPGLAPGAPGRATAPPDPDLPYRIAATVWGPEIHTFLTAAMGKINLLDEQGPVVVWAATVPTPGIRHQVYQVLKAQWNEGPGGLQKAGFPNQTVCDPAILVALKQLPRAKAFKSGTMPGVGTPGYPRPTSPTGTGKTLPPAVQQKLQREQTEEDWLRVSADLVLALCQRLEQAGLREIEIARQQRRRPDFNAPIQDLPIQLHESQLTPKPSYRVALPGEVGKKISGVSLAPTLIHYVRLEHKEKPSKVSEAYKRQLKTRRMYELPQMIWLDALQPGRSPELLRSIDVIITRAQSGAGPGGGMPAGGPGLKPGAREKEVEEPLVIQILVIEIRDPSQDPTQAPSAARVSEEKP